MLPGSLLVFHHILSGFLRVFILLHPGSIFHGPVEVVFDKGLHGRSRHPPGVGETQLLGYFDDERFIVCDADGLEEFVLFVVRVVVGGRGRRCC